MTVVLLGLGGPASFFAQAGDVDVGSTLAVYGVAAPFAALCFWQMLRSQKRETEQEERAQARETELEARWRTRVAELEARIETLHREALQREQQLVSGLAPRIYDGALLYREGTRVAEQAAATGPAVEAAGERIDELAGKLDRLIEGMAEDRRRTDDPGRRGPGPSGAR